MGVGEANSFNARSMDIFKAFIVKAVSEFESHPLRHFLTFIKERHSL